MTAQWQISVTTDKLQKTIFTEHTFPQEYVVQKEMSKEISQRLI